MGSLALQLQSLKTELIQSWTVDWVLATRQNVLYNRKHLVFTRFPPVVCNFRQYYILFNYPSYSMSVTTACCHSQMTQVVPVSASLLITFGLCLKASHWSLQALVLWPKPILMIFITAATCTVNLHFKKCLFLEWFHTYPQRSPVDFEAKWARSALMLF